MDFWKNLLNSEDKHEKIQQINIKKTSKEAVADMLNDDSDSVPDDIPDDQEGGTDQQDNESTDSNSSGGDDSFSMDMDSGEDNGTVENEPTKLKKNQYSDVNGKLRIMEQYDILIDSAQKALEMFQSNEYLKLKYEEILSNLIQVIIEAKNNAPLSTKVENLTRYNLLYRRLEEILNSGVNEVKTNTDSKNKD